MDYNILLKELSEQSSDITLGTAATYIYTGPGGNTWALPSLSANSGKRYQIKNAGSGNLVIASGGTDHMYDNTSVTSITLTPSETKEVIAGSGFWYVL